MGGFHNELFPEGISYGSTSGPGFRTEIDEFDSGLEQRTAMWESARHQYDAASGLKKPEDGRELLAFVHRRLGSAYSFRWKDEGDHTTHINGKGTPSNIDVEIGIGDASETQFQLVVKYSDLTVVRTRNIYLPRQGTYAGTLQNTVVVALDGVDQPSGWSVSDVTGLLTFSTAPGAGVVVTAGFQFDVKGRFGEEADALFALTHINFETMRAETLPVIEDKDPTPIADEYNFGGAKHVTITAPTEVTPDARHWTFRKTSGTYRALLPTDLTNYPGGGFYFIIKNEATVTLSLYDESGVEIGPIAANTGTALISVGLNISSVKGWRATLLP